MQPIDFLVFAIYFALEAFGHVGPSPIAYFFLALALLIGPAPHGRVDHVRGREAHRAVRHVETSVETG